MWCATCAADRNESSLKSLNKLLGSISLSQKNVCFKCECRCRLCCSTEHPRVQVGGRSSRLLDEEQERLRSSDLVSLQCCCMSVNQSRNSVLVCVFWRGFTSFCGSWLCLSVFVRISFSFRSEDTEGLRLGFRVKCLVAMVKVERNASCGLSQR